MLFNGSTVYSIFSMQTGRLAKLFSKELNCNIDVRL